MKKYQQTHGKNEFSKKRTLDQVLGYTGFSKYQTMDKAEYEQQISSMNKSDLQKHSILHGLVPIDNRETLQKRLVREFEKHVASFEGVELPPNTASKDKDINKKALDILSYGR